MPNEPAQRMLETTAINAMSKMGDILKADPQARDWAGFFAALAAFISAVMPLIVPLFAEKSK